MSSGNPYQGWNSSFSMLKYKLRHIKKFKCLFEQKLILMSKRQIGSCSKHSTDRSKGKGLYRKGLEIKKRDYFIGYSLKPSWPFAIGCP